MGLPNKSYVLYFYTIPHFEYKYDLMFSSSKTNLFSESVCYGNTIHRFVCGFNTMGAGLNDKHMANKILISALIKQFFCLYFAIFENIHGFRSNKHRINMVLRNILVQNKGQGHYLNQQLSSSTLYICIVEPLRGNIYYEEHILLTWFNWD